MTSVRVKCFTWTLSARIWEAAVTSKFFHTVVFHVIVYYCNYISCSPYMLFFLLKAPFHFKMKLTLNLMAFEVTTHLLFYFLLFTFFSKTKDNHHHRVQMRNCSEWVLMFKVLNPDVFVLFKILNMFWVQNWLLYFTLDLPLLQPMTLTFF